GEKSGSSKIGVVGWHFAPGDQSASRFAADRGDQLLQCDLLPLILWDEKLANAIRIKVAQRRNLRMKKFMRLLQQHTRAVTGLLFGATRAAMIEIAQDAQPIFDQLMGPRSIQIDECANTAGPAIRTR